MTLNFERPFSRFAAFALAMLPGLALAQVMTPTVPSSRSANPSASPSAPVGAAAPKSAAGAPPILTIESLPSSPSSPDVFVQDLLDEDARRAPRGPSRPTMPVFESEPQTSRWARSSFGAYIAFGSATVVNAPFRITQDEILVGRGSESGVGLGALLDFGMPAAQDEAYRLKIGVHRQSLTPSIEDRAYAVGEVEVSAVVLDISLLYRYSLPYLGELGHLWIGGGGSLDYALTSSRPDVPTVVPLSRVRNSYAFRAIVALGAEIPVSGIHDIVLEADWSFLKGYSLLMGFKTSL